MSTLDVIKNYYNSQSNKDDHWKDLWSDDAVFSDASQTLLAKGKEAVIQSFTPFLKGVAALKISQMIVEGDNLLRPHCLQTFYAGLEYVGEITRYSNKNPVALRSVRSPSGTYFV